MIKEITKTQTNRLKNQIEEKIRTTVKAPIFEAFKKQCDGNVGWTVHRDYAFPIAAAIEGMSSQLRRIGASQLNSYVWPYVDGHFNAAYFAWSYGVQEL